MSHGSRPRERSRPQAQGRRPPHPPRSINSLSDKLSRCAARRARHHASYSRTLQLSIIIFMCFQASLSRSVANNSAKNKQFCNACSRLYDVKIIKHEFKSNKNQTKIRSGVFLGAIWGDLGSSLVPGWPQARKWGPPRRDQFLFGTKKKLGPAFRGLVLYCFRGVCFFDF